LISDRGVTARVLMDIKGIRFKKSIVLEFGADLNNPFFGGVDFAYVQVMKQAQRMLNTLGDLVLRRCVFPFRIEASKHDDEYCLLKLKRLKSNAIRPQQGTSFCRRPLLNKGDGAMRSCIAKRKCWPMPNGTNY